MNKSYSARERAHLQRIKELPCGVSRVCRFHASPLGVGLNCGLGFTGAEAKEWSDG